MSGLYAHNLNYSPARVASPYAKPCPDDDSEYLTKLLEERQNFQPFVQVLPICSRLLNREILRVSGMIPSQGFNEYATSQNESLTSVVSLNLTPNASENTSGSWSGVGWNGLLNEKCNDQVGVTMDWLRASGMPCSHLVKKVLRLDIPANCYPNFNFVGRLLGPRGNSLKRLEASTGCHVFIRGRGSIKDPQKEEDLRGKPGYEHLNDPLHILIKAELPANIIDKQLSQAREIIEEVLKPVKGESWDFYKQQQLRELAVLNSNFKEGKAHVKVE